MKYSRKVLTVYREPRNLCFLPFYCFNPEWITPYQGKYPVKWLDIGLMSCYHNSFSKLIYNKNNNTYQCIMAVVAFDACSGAIIEDILGT